MTLNRGLDISKFTMKRLVNLIEHMIKTNAKDDNERNLLIEQLYEVPEELADQSKKPLKKKRRSGKEKIAEYVKKQQTKAQEQLIEEVGKVNQPESEEVKEPKEPKKPRRVKTPPPGFGMSKEQALAMMESARAEDEELIRGKR